MARWKWNSDTFRGIRTSPQMQAALKTRADAIAARANADHVATARTSPPPSEDSFEVSVRVGRTRARASVTTANPRAMAHERRDSSLLRSIA